MKKFILAVFVIMALNVIIYMMVAFLPAEATKGYDKFMNIWGITALFCLLSIIVGIIIDAMEVDHEK